MKTEQLQPGQGAPALGAAPQSAELNAGLPFLGSGSEAGKAVLAKFEAAGNMEENPAEMGGGGDAIDDWVDKKGGYDKLLQQIQQNRWADNAVWKLPDGTKLSVAEVRRRAATAVTPPPPEPQPAPRSAGWREGLQPEQRQRLQIFEAKIANLDVSQLQVALGRLKQLQAVAPIEGWQSKEIREEDASVCLRVIMERIEEMSKQREAVGDIRSIVKVARITGWRPSPDEFDPEIDLSAGGTNGT